MELIVAPVITVLVVLALLGLGITGFSMWDRKKTARKKATGTTLDDSIGYKRLRPDRSGRWMMTGVIIFVFSIGMLIGMLSTYIMSWLGWG